MVVVLIHANFFAGKDHSQLVSPSGASIPHIIMISLWSTGGGSGSLLAFSSGMLLLSSRIRTMDFFIATMC